MPDVRLRTRWWRAAARRLRLLPPLSLLLSGPAFAGNAGWTDTTTVAELTASAQHRYTVRLHLTKNPSGCRSPDTFYQDYAAPGSEQMFRALLEAVTSGKRVRVYVSGRCELNGYAELSSVTLLP